MAKLWCLPLMVTVLLLLHHYSCTGRELRSLGSASTHYLTHLKLHKSKTSEEERLKRVEQTPTAIEKDEEIQEEIYSNLEEFAASEENKHPEMLSKYGALETQRRGGLAREKSCTGRELPSLGSIPIDYLTKQQLHNLKMKEKKRKVKATLNNNGNARMSTSDEDLQSLNNNGNARMSTSDEDLQSQLHNLQTVQQTRSNAEAAAVLVLEKGKEYAVSMEAVCSRYEGIFQTTRRSVAAKEELPLRAYLEMAEANLQWIERRISRLQGQCDKVAQLQPPSIYSQLASRLTRVLNRLKGLEAEMPRVTKSVEVALGIHNPSQSQPKMPKNR